MASDNGSTIMELLKLFELQPIWDLTFTPTPSWLDSRPEIKHDVKGWIEEPNLVARTEPLPEGSPLSPEWTHGLPRCVLLHGIPRELEGRKPTTDKLSPFSDLINHLLEHYNVESFAQHKVIPIAYFCGTGLPRNMKNNFPRPEKTSVAKSTPPHRQSLPSFGPQSTSPRRFVPTFETSRQSLIRNDSPGQVRHSPGPRNNPPFSNEPPQIYSPTSAPQPLNAASQPIPNLNNPLLRNWPGTTPPSTAPSTSPRLHPLKPALTLLLRTITLQLLHVLATPNTPIPNLLSNPSLTDHGHHSGREYLHIINSALPVIKRKGTTLLIMLDSMPYSDAVRTDFKKLVTIIGSIKEVEIKFMIADTDKRWEVEMKRVFGGRVQVWGVSQLDEGVEIAGTGKAVRTKGGGEVRGAWGGGGSDGSSGRDDWRNGRQGGDSEWTPVDSAEDSGRRVSGRRSLDWRRRGGHEEHTGAQWVNNPRGS
ncbi:hypothetical protein OQA88_13130 [Cercophora sp. LCS_1]